jgi:hypothetical protein
MLGGDGAVDQLTGRRSSKGSSRSKDRSPPGRSVPLSVGGKRFGRCLCVAFTVSGSFRIMRSAGLWVGWRFPPAVAGVQRKHRLRKRVRSRKRPAPTPFSWWNLLATLVSPAGETPTLPTTRLARERARRWFALPLRKPDSSRASPMPLSPMESPFAPGWVAARPAYARISFTMRPPCPSVSDISVPLRLKVSFSCSSPKRWSSVAW